MSTEHDKQTSGPSVAPPGEREPSDVYGRQSSAELLLDLVRSAEEGATVTTDTPAPSEEADGVESPTSDEFVEVGDDAVDAPASTPPSRASSGGEPQPGAAARAAVPDTKMGARGATVEAASGRISPVLGIVVPFALAIIALIAVTR